MNLFAFAALLSALTAPATAADPAIWNAWEVHHGLHLDASLAPQVKATFPSFLEYQDLMLFHPKFGYYSSGRVNFVSDYRTFPSMLAPYFGQMIAAQAERMWEGMRSAGTLDRGERFTIAEFGAGDGAMAESILDYMQAQAARDPRWREFYEQAVYACYDRSPALSAAQAKRNARFGSRFEARTGDATDPAASIPPGSLKGVIVSNELPDAFSVHKVILNADGSAEVAFVAPWLTAPAWNRMQKSLPADVRDLILREAAAIRDQVLPDQQDPGALYLSRASLVALLESVAAAPDYAAKVHSIQFHEIYVPVSIFPDLAAHLRQYAHAYATELARGDAGMVAYINLGEGKFVHGAAQILKAGYVLTVDYGSNWDGITPRGDFDHLRIYGPKTKQHTDAYQWPTLNDITTDVNFSHMAAEGEASGLKTVYFGPQSALASGAAVSMAVVPANRPKKEFKQWAADFQADSVFKLLVQQKTGTDPAYAYPDEHRQHIDLDEYALSESQKPRAAILEQKLSTTSFSLSFSPVDKLKLVLP